jgi:WD40 repeat protein
MSEPSRQPHGCAALLCVAAGLIAGCRAPGVTPVATGGAPVDDAAAPPPTGAPPPPFISWPDVGEAPPPSTLPIGEPELVPKPWAGKHVAPGLSGDPAGAFTGAAAPMGAPRVVYPLDGSMHPINIFQITIQWTRGNTTSTVFRLHFENQGGTFDVFAPCAAAQCTFQMPEAAWQTIAESNPDRDVRLSIAGSAGPGSPVATSPAITIRFTPARVKGALYYWSTKLKGTYRLTFGQKKAMPFMIPTGDHACYGCHAVSRNGKTIAMLAADDTGQNILAAVTEDPVNTAHRFQEVGSSAPMSLTADGSKVLVAWNQGLTLNDVQSGMRLAAVKKNDPRLLGQGASFPEWSPDGTQVAVMVGNQITPYEMLPCGIGLLPYENGMFGTVKMIVPAGPESHFYPSWSPDGKWIVFASSPMNNNYDNANARLRLVGAEGGTVYDMTRATRAKGVTSTWPKFSPFAQLGNQLLFVTFSSKMPYGFVVDGQPQLWFAAIDLRRLAQGDPSWAPVWLPFQEADQTNHLGFWTEVITCQEDEKCGEFAVCKAGACVPVIIQ